MYDVMGAIARGNVPVIYDYLLKFLRPFTEKDVVPKIWNSSNSAWDDIGMKKKPSILGRIHELNGEIARTDRV